MANPFGLQMLAHGESLRRPGRSNNVAFSGNQYKFGSKELDDENNLNYYHFEARGYDPEIGRWFVIDPLHNLYPSQSSYTYVLNNPINNFDYDGRQVGSIAATVGEVAGAGLSGGSLLMSGGTIIVLGGTAYVMKDSYDAFTNPPANSAGPISAEDSFAPADATAINLERSKTKAVFDAEQSKKDQASQKSKNEQKDKKDDEREQRKAAKEDQQDQLKKAKELQEQKDPVVNLIKSIGDFISQFF